MLRPVRHSPDPRAFGTFDDNSFIAPVDLSESGIGDDLGQRAETVDIHGCPAKGANGLGKGIRMRKRERERLFVYA